LCLLRRTKLWDNWWRDRVGDFIRWLLPTGVNVQGKREVVGKGEVAARSAACDDSSGNKLHEPPTPAGYGNHQENNNRRNTTTTTTTIICPVGRCPSSSTRADLRPWYAS
ncbi:unnamed protein product, partial [Ectocarpus sp. 8 AP-2014]